MGKAPSHKKVRFGAKKKDRVISCSRQFPDCPTEPNDEFCKPCPLYKK